MSRSPLRKMSGLEPEEFDRQKQDAEQFIQQTGVLVGLICMYDDEMSGAIMDAAQSYDTLVSMFDPTRYMYESNQAHTNARMVKIVRDAKKKLTELGLCP